MDISSRHFYTFQYKCETEQTVTYLSNAEGSFLSRRAVAWRVMMADDRVCFSPATVRSCAPWKVEAQLQGAYPCRRKDNNKSSQDLVSTPVLPRHFINVQQQVFVSHSFTLDTVLKMCSTFLNCLQNTRGKPPPLAVRKTTGNYNRKSVLKPVCHRSLYYCDIIPKTVQQQRYTYLDVVISGLIGWSLILRQKLFLLQPLIDHGDKINMEGFLRGNKKSKYTS